MKTGKSRIAVLLALAMIAAALTGCGSANETETKTTTNPDSSDDTTSPYLDSLGSYNFGGKEFTVLCRDTSDGIAYNEVAVDEENGDVIDDAVYNRNIEVSERFNVKIKANRVIGNWPNRDEFTTTLKTSVLAGDGAFDLILGYQAYSANTDITECLYDFTDLPLINLDAEYYYHDIIDEVMVNGKLYYIAGDYTYSVWPSLFVFYFNKQIAENNNVGDLYSLVREGSWTLDKLNELCANVYQDLNGNAEKDDADLFGLATDYENVADAYYSALQVKITDRDASGIPVINKDISKMEEVVGKLNKLYHESDGVYSLKTHSSMTTNPLAKIFTESRALFYPDVLGKAITFRDMTADFGIIPYPKWDEEQDKYYTQPNNAYSVMMVPTDAKDTEMTSVMIEALNAASYKTVIPAVYDKSLKVKFTRDEDSADMLDIIREGISFHFGYYYTVTLNNGATAWRMRDILSSQGNVASTFASCSERLEANLQKIIDFYN